MFVKQIGLAVLAATILTGSAAVANAESNLSGVDGGPTSEPALQRGYQSYGSVAYAPISSGSHAYGYANHSRTYVRHHQARTTNHR
jgi:hypothetical protein